jgi:hypothetical protein
MLRIAGNKKAVILTLPNLTNANTAEISEKHTHTHTMKINKHFEKMVTGNVLAEILREVERAMDAANRGDSIGSAIYLEYVQTIVDDACDQYGANAVFGNLEVSKLVTEKLIALEGGSK